jgi:hypothetical protein
MHKTGPRAFSLSSALPNRPYRPLILDRWWLRGSGFGTVQAVPGALDVLAAALWLVLAGAYLAQGPGSSWPTSATLSCRRSCRLPPSPRCSWPRWPKTPRPPGACWRRGPSWCRSTNRLVAGERGADGCRRAAWGGIGRTRLGPFPGRHLGQRQPVEVAQRERGPDWGRGKQLRTSHRSSSRDGWRSR